MISLVLATFATYRLALMLATEEGPFEMCTRIRNLHTQDDWIGRGLRCPLCVGFWIALVLAWVVAPAGAAWLYWLGIAGAQTALTGVTHAR